MIIKCKMCGGDLEITEGLSVAECEYCGTKQTVPNVNSEKKMTLFGRANRLRLACEFDKAAAVYENLVAEFPEEAEAYWGLVLCRYGIEYVDDPITGKKVPTCHRSSFDSVLEDGDFEQACENADMVARKLYREEAKTIEAIRRGILEVSDKEQPYDIFICYKETDANGQRTIDSVLAQDVYDTLIDKGYRVFFSRITLEGKLGTEYEPHIFAALHSAKIMLVFGTDYEYFNAVWVKNEWSRFLKLMAKDKEKYLIPCYKSVDAYDMPKEFLKLQAQDLGKVGAVQDLLRGIEKLLGDRQPELAGETMMVQQSGGVTVGSLLRRGQLFLEDGNWDNANEYFDKALDIDPECVDAYVGKLCVDCRCKAKDELQNQNREFSNNGSYQKAIRFASSEQKNQLMQWNTAIAKERERVKAEQCKKIQRWKERFGKTCKFITSGYYHTVGLKADGTVVAVGDNEDGQCNVEDWTDIVAVAVGRAHTVGLKADGTVVAVGSNGFNQCNVEDWTDIVAISAGDYHTVGLKADGSVVAVGDNRYGQCNVKDWTDIVAVATASDHTVGLKADGTVVAVGRNESGECNVEDWTDIVAVAAGQLHTVGLKADGTVVAVGNNTNGKCEVENWKLFGNIDAVEQERAEAIKRRREEKQRQEEKRRQEEEARRQEEEARREAKERQRREEKRNLENVRAHLQEELLNTKGLFAGKRRREIRNRLTWIETELQKYV